MDQASSREEQWAYYVDSYYMHADTEGVATDLLSPPWIRRSVPSTDISPQSIFVNEMHVKICLNSYKLFYLVNTEDTLVREKSDRTVTAKTIEYNRKGRAKDGKKWTAEGYRTKEAENAAAEAAAEAREQNIVPHAATLGPSAVDQGNSPPATSVTPVPQPEIPRSVDTTPLPTEQKNEDDVKIESPPVAPDASDTMDIETTDPIEPTVEVSEVVIAQDERNGGNVDEDTEMPDA